MDPIIRLGYKQHIPQIQRSLMALFSKTACWGLAVLSLILVTSSSFVAKGQGMPEEDLLGRKVTLALTDMPSTVLRSVSAIARVPIGIEVIPDSNRTVTINQVRGTVRQILEEIVNAEPRYKWVVRDGVINLLPRERNESPLDVMIPTFKMRDVNAEDVPAALINLPEIQNWLSSAGIQGDRGLMYEGPIRNLPVFSITISNYTVKEILNEIIRKGYSTFWQCRIYGKEQRRLSLQL